MHFPTHENVRRNFLSEFHCGQTGGSSNAVQFCLSFSCFAFPSTMGAPSIGPNESIFNVNLGLFGICFDRIIGVRTDLDARLEHAGVGVGRGLGVVRERVEENVPALERCSERVRGARVAAGRRDAERAQRPRQGWMAAT